MYFLIIKLQDSDVNWEIFLELLKSMPVLGLVLLSTSAVPPESSGGLVGLFCAGSFRPTVPSLFMLGGFTVGQEVNGSS